MFRHTALLVHGLEKICLGCVCCAATGAHQYQLGLAKAKRDAMQLPAALATLVTVRPLRVRRELWDFTATASYARYGGTVRHCWRACWWMGLFEILYCTILYCALVSVRRGGG